MKILLSKVLAYYKENCTEIYNKELLKCVQFKFPIV